MGEPRCREPAGHWDGGEGCPHLGRAAPSQCWQDTGPSASQCRAGDLAAPSAGAGAEGSRGGKGWGKGERVGWTEKTPERRAEMNKQCSSGPWGLRDTHTLLAGPHLHLNLVRVAVEKALEKLQKHKCILGLRTKSWFILAGTLHLFFWGGRPKRSHQTHQARPSWGQGAQAGWWWPSLTPVCWGGLETGKKAGPGHPNFHPPLSSSPSPQPSPRLPFASPSSHYFRVKKSTMKKITAKIHTERG